MPELPDVTIYCEALARHVLHASLVRIDLANPFVLRTAVPPIEESFGREVIEVRRLGKRIVLRLTSELYLVLHLMIAGRLRWLDEKAKPPGRITLAVLTFSTGRLAFTEAGTKRRASLHLVQGEEALAALDAGGVDVRDLSLDEFSARLVSANHTLKRAVTDPHLFSGIGNAYSDEILHRAKLSPIALTQKLGAAEIARLYVATRDVFEEWIRRLREQSHGDFPDKVTAFRPEMAVHGKFGAPCPV